MQNHSLRNLAGSSGGRPEPDSDGLLYDPAVRAGFAQMGDKADVAPLEALAALRLASKQAHTAMERWTESLGLSESRLRVLMALHYSPAHRRPLGELAEILNVVPRTVTDVIDVLERDGTIAGGTDAADRRAVQAQRHPAGPGAEFPGHPRWYFGNFLIGRDGQVLARFEPDGEPSDSQIVKAIEDALAKK